MSCLRVLLVGTSHTYQYGARAKRASKPCTRQQEEAFRALIRSDIQIRGVSAIAEEFNSECLEEGQIDVSVLQSLAKELGVPHLFCELNRQEREALGIKQENDIRISNFFSGGSEADIQECLRKQFREREVVWLQRLRGFGHSPVLYVCGADHVRSFSALLSEAVIPVEVLHADWQA